MFSDLYYLSQLIDKSLSFSIWEKKKIFTYVKKNPNEVIRVIEVFEDEQKGINFIKKDYQKNLGKIGNKFKKSLQIEILNKQMEKFINIKNNITKIKNIEKGDIDNTNLDGLINNL